MTTEVDGEPQATHFLRRVLMRLLLVLVATAVVVAIVQVLRGVPLGVTIGRMIWTSVVAGIFGLFAASCANAAEEKPTGFAFAGIALIVISIALFFFGFWFEIESVHFWKAFAIASLFSVALWRCARFSLATLGPIGSVVAKVTMGASLAVAAVITVMILRERADTMLVRVMNALWLLVIGGHIAVPILQRLHNPPPKDG